MEESSFLDDDAMAATAYVLRCISSGSATDAMLAAKRGYDAGDARAQSQKDFSVYTREVEASLLASPEVQRELQQQVDDLAMLENRDDADILLIQGALRALGV